MKQSTEKQLAFIILDIVAIIAILAVVLVADLADQNEKNAVQKLILGDALAKLRGENPTIFPDKTYPCRIVECPYGQQPFDMGVTDDGHEICVCPNGDRFLISRIQYYAGNYKSKP
ncbi:MAG: hypothetical protein QW666_00470 [Candidatus Woesearchaeota archaeon]